MKKAENRKVKIILIAIISIAILAGATTAGIKLTSEKPESTISEKTTAVKEAVTLDVEHQANVDEAQKYSSKELMNVKTSAVADEYNGYIYRTTYKVDHMKNSGKIVKENIKTGKCEDFIDVITKDLLIYNDYLYYINYENAGLYRVNLKKNIITPEKIGKYDIMNQADGAMNNGYYKIYLKENKILFSSPHGDYFARAYEYSPETGEVRKLSEKNSFVNKEGYYTEFVQDEEDGEYISRYDYYDNKGKLIISETDNESDFEVCYENDEYIAVHYPDHNTFNDDKIIVINKNNGNKTVVKTLDSNVAIVNNTLYYCESIYSFDGDDELPSYTNETIKSVKLK